MLVWLGSSVFRFCCFGDGVGRVPFLRFVSRVRFGLAVCLLDLCVVRRGRRCLCVVACCGVGHFRVVAGFGVVCPCRWCALCVSAVRWLVAVLVVVRARAVASRVLCVQAGRAHELYESPARKQG